MNEHRFPWKPIAALLVLHAMMIGLALGGVMLLGHLSCRQIAGPSRIVTSAADRTATKFEDGKQDYDPRLLPINQRALAEVKQGQWVFNPNTGENVWCPDCPSLPRHPNDVIVPTRVPARPTPAPPSQPPVLQPSIDRVVTAPKQHQIMLFLLPGDPLSAKLKSWFDSNPTLMQWKRDGTYHEFTPDNKLYLTLTNRGVALRDQMPASAFPAALFTAPDGGHIHAAIRQFIPATAEELIADVGRGKQNWKSMRESIPGTVPMSAYNFDDYINPKTRKPVCPGPDCPNQTEPHRPSARIVDLFPHAEEKAEGMVKDAIWGWLDIIVTAVVVLCVVAALVVAFLVAALLLAYIVRSRRLKQ